jgi:flagellar biosynthesis chaperone FliJ
MWPFGKNEGAQQLSPEIVEERAKREAGEAAFIKHMQQISANRLAQMQQKMGSGISGPLNGLYGGPLSGQGIFPQQQPGIYTDPYVAIRIQEYQNMEAWINEVHPEVMEEYRAIEALKKSVDKAESHTV